MRRSPRVPIGSLMLLGLALVVDPGVHAHRGRRAGAVVRAGRRGDDHGQQCRSRRAAHPVPARPPAADAPRRRLRPGPLRLRPRASHVEVQSGPGAPVPEVAAVALDPGTYEVRDDATSPRLTSGTIRVLGRDDHPDVSLYEGQELTGARLDILGNLVPGLSLEDGFNYIETRDGVLLSAMVRFPDPAFYGPGPYPTVVEYSGYGPSNPASEEPGVRIARAMGYATVSP